MLRVRVRVCVPARSARPVDPEVYAEAAAESQGGPVEIEGGGVPHVANGMVTSFTVS